MPLKIRVNEFRAVQVSRFNPMKTPRLLTLLLALAAIFATLAPRTARAEVSFEFFYDALEPMGEWVKVDSYGYCWHPTEVDDDWAPYTDGYWTYTDAGWTWVSYEDWGGICYHYGRWVRIEDEGWCWVPDYQWGPAWVSWRHSDEYVGWAPLPPEAHFTVEVGFSTWVDTSYDIGPSYYNFCHVHDFGAPVIRAVCLPRTRNVTIIQNTVNITNITYNNNSRVVFNGGPQYNVIAARSARPIPALKLVQNTNVAVVNGAVAKNQHKLLPRAIQRGNALEVFAPAIAAPASVESVKPAKVARALPKEKINKGWSAVADPAARTALRQKYQQEAGTTAPAAAPAKPVQAADLKVVPQKADPSKPSPAVVAKEKAPKNPAAAPNVPVPSAPAPAVALPEPVQSPTAVPQQPVAGKKGRAGKPAAAESAPPSVATPTVPSAPAPQIPTQVAPAPVQPKVDPGMSAREKAQTEKAEQARAKAAAAQRQKLEAMEAETQRNRAAQEAANEKFRQQQQQFQQPKKVAPQPKAPQFEPNVPPVRTAPARDNSAAAAAAQERQAAIARQQAEARQNAFEMQRAQQAQAAKAAAAREQAEALQAQRAAAVQRQQQIRPQIQQPPPIPQRQVPQPVPQRQVPQQTPQFQQRQMPPQQTIQQLPPSGRAQGGGKRPLTPEEAAALQKQRGF